MTDTISLSLSDAEELAFKACAAAGADAASARALAEATLSASRFGPATLGFPHFVDYLHSYRDGRINRSPQPKLARPFPALLHSNADGGLAQLGFDQAFDEFVATIQQLGVAIFTQNNSYTAGELGYYVRRLAKAGIVAIAATNGNALMAAKPGGKAIYSTNPLAFGFPLGEGHLPLVIDQASSATAYVNLVAAAAAGQAIPEGWAIDRHGEVTANATEALAGALLPFGGYKGGNIALMVEMLAAGMSGGPWSLDTADFRSGNQSPAIGLTIIAFLPGQDGDTARERARRQIERLAAQGLFMPGITGRDASRQEITMSEAIFASIRDFMRTASSARE